MNGRSVSFDDVVCVCPLMITTLIFEYVAFTLLNSISKKSVYVVDRIDFRTTVLRIRIKHREEILYDNSIIILFRMNIQMFHDKC